MKELTYKVPRQAYVGLLAQMIRKNERRPLRVATTLLMTVGQMAAVGALCLFRLEGGQRVFFLVWSLLLSALTILRRCTVRQRAGGTLERLEYTGQLSEDFWKEHRLQITDQELRLRYGGQSLRCPLRGLSRVEEREDAVDLYCGDTVVDIVPLAAFSGREAMAAWAEELRGAAAGAPIEAEGDGVRWVMEERAFEEGQYQAYRVLYYRYRFLRPATFLRLAVSTAAVITLMNDRSTVNVLLCGALLVLASLENISMIPALCRLRVRRELGPWRGSREYCLELREDRLLFSSDRARTEIPVHKINLCQELGEWYLIAWSEFPAVVLPRETAREAASLLKQIQALYQG